MNYTYSSSIGPNELRLLQPVSITHNRLHFRILTTPRAAAPPYIAVSYAWGETEASEKVHLDDQPFPVRLNLWNCLFHISQALRSVPENHIWVDAICINQADSNEKNAQVASMDQTYRRAACVSAWLGLAPVPEHLQPLLTQREPIRTLEVDDLDWSEHINDLANRPYWSRFWVIQEVLLAKDVTVHCSNVHVGWFEFQTILCMEAGLEQFGGAYGTSSISNDAIAQKYRALPLVTGRHPDKHPEILQSLHDLIIEHRGSQCKDQKDRIFALLGLVTVDERVWLARFFPDYTLSNEHVLVITLAHLTQLSPLYRSRHSAERITPDSEELFQGLGVVSRKQRKKHLRQAERFDYLDPGDRGASVSQMLDFQESLERYLDVDTEVLDETGIATASSTGVGRAIIWIGLLGVAGGVAFVVSGRWVKIW